VTDEGYHVRYTRAARRALSDELPVHVVDAVLALIDGDLAREPDRSANRCGLRSMKPAAPAEAPIDSCTRSTNRHAPSPSRPSSPAPTPTAPTDPDRARRPRLPAPIDPSPSRRPRPSPSRHVKSITPGQPSSGLTGPYPALRTPKASAARVARRGRCHRPDLVDAHRRLQPRSADANRPGVADRPDRNSADRRRCRDAETMRSGWDGAGRQLELSPVSAAALRAVLAVKVVGRWPTSTARSTSSAGHRRARV
jgi:hypothetical protein